MMAAVRYWGLWASALLVGIVLTAGSVIAQPGAAAQGPGSGVVLQIGFEGHFQPSGWVPMRVRINPPGRTGLYLLRVHQRDLDGDEVIFERTIGLTAGTGAQEFWTYFKPEPSRGGFDPGRLDDLRRRLRVVVADEAGVELFALGITRPVEPLYSGTMDRADGREARLVLFVADPGGGFMPGSEELIPGAAVGFSQRMAPVPVTTASLPDRAIGYESVDAVVWQEADPAQLGPERLAALREWVRRGGHLVVSGQSQWQVLEPMFDMLPVTPTGAYDRDDLQPVRSLLAGTAGVGTNPEGWNTVQGPFRYVSSRVNEKAIVERWMIGDNGQEEPFLARHGYGFGCVSWVAIDVGDRRVTRGRAGPTRGWSSIWSVILSTGDRPILDPTTTDQERFSAAGFRDIGATTTEGTRMAGRSLALVTVAMVFFIGYWLLAGPGLFFWLASKRRQHLSWFAFGLAAVAATLVTVLVVRVVLRGPPELRHLTLVRLGVEAEQLVHADLGLYIPRDGVQRVVLEGAAAGSLPTVTGLPIHPAHRTDDGRRTNPIRYVVPLDPPEPDRVAAFQGTATITDIPYRSTLKKLQAQWVGPERRGIGGNPRLIDGQGLIAGTLVNGTGHDLRNVYFCFRHPRAPGAMGSEGVWVVYLPRWRAGEQIASLSGLIAPPDGPSMKLVDPTTTPRTAQPTAREPVHGSLTNDWSRYWYSGLRSAIIAPQAEAVIDLHEAVPRSIPMLSLYSLLPPMLNEGTRRDATIPLRRGAHDWDISAAVTAGNLVVIAEAENAPVPLPLRVEGRRVEGRGRIVFQCVLPLDRAEVTSRRRTEADLLIPEPLPEEESSRPDEEPQLQPPVRQPRAAGAAAGSASETPQPD